MKLARKWFGDLAHAVLERGARRATKYLSETQVISAARVIFGGRIDKRDRRTEIVFKVGAPNYLEREFIKAAKKAGESFPVRKLQLRFLKA